MRSRNEILTPMILCLLGCLTSLSQTAHATTVGELTDVQAQAVLAEARVRLAEAQAKLPPKPNTTAASTGTTTQPTKDVDLPAPVVRTIYGAGGRMTASFLFPGGVEADAGAGQDLPGGYHVESVSMDKVMLSKSGKRFPVGFSNVAPSASTTMTQMGSMVAPALPGATMGQHYQPTSPLGQ
ncbi:Type IV pilus biogenesis protein PilP [Pseudomonas sp. 8Z]|uniref:type IV pilus biogenesis protein PilP n=1 Tax=Pseudomonas sp. 8Z TaxID=2653166 RepID=UPI0012F2A070|nr:type IV pilus biogenesis protein PilP [Pseudomonas sp. 8Z]VXC24364.1 Type IV pilus biogenesis protein PilP [Pseudomonas sp. 8Z]